jgi:putative ABC transport system permease protein
MFKSYLKIAWRNLMKNKIFSFINIFGLSAGLACCMLISLYLLNELNYDTYHKHASDIYEVATIFKVQHKSTPWASTPAPMASGLQREFPQIATSTRLMGLFNSEDKTLLKYDQPGSPQVSFYETRGFLADSTFFRMFDYHFTEGDPATALNNPATVVLSEEVAKKLFGNRPALNKVIHVSSNTNGEHDFKITGVYQLPRSPSHIDGRFFLSMNGGDVEYYIRQQSNDYATNNMFFTYLQLRPGSDPKKLEAAFPAFLDKYAGKDLKAVGFDKSQFLIPLKDIHLRTDVGNSNVTPAASRTYLYILASIALFTLLIACINFMNLATARSSRRSAEVGVRKVLGAEKKFLIGQFLGEAVLMSLIAFLFAWGIALLLLPAFGMMTGTPLSLSLPAHLPLVGAFLGLAILTGLIAGSYPAFYLSSFKPVQVLKGKFQNSLAAVSLRKGLVVFQFVISVSLIVAAVVINDQMRFLRTQDLGFEKAEQIVVPLRSETAKKTYALLKNRFAATPQARSAGAANYYPGIVNPSDNLLYRPERSVNEAKVTRLNQVDPSYLQTLDIKVAAGRLFSEEFRGDTADRIILNENAIQAFGFASPQDAIGKKLAHNYKGTTGYTEIVGVVKDFHYEDMHLPITPYGFTLNRDSMFNYIIVHARSGQAAQLLRSMGTIWHAVNPSEPFEYSFLDADFQKNYRAEERLSAMIKYFTVMAILISCLGLFGLASFSAEQRTKEIGIRKVLGASITGIVLLLSRDFLKLVSVAVIIACPIAWYFMHRWLEDFAYRTPIDWTVFPLTFIIALFIALFTISFQAIRTALANPVKSLKTE